MDVFFIADFLSVRGAIKILLRWELGITQPPHSHIPRGILPIIYAGHGDLHRRITPFNFEKPMYLLYVIGMQLKFIFLKINLSHINAK